MPSLDGETMVDPGNPASQGQVVILDRRRAGTLAGVRRLSYDGRELPVDETDLQVPQITTRDVDRGDAPHYLLKEISEAPASFRKTLRGKIAERDGVPVVELPHETLSEGLRARLRAIAKDTDRSVHSIIVEAVEKHAAHEEQMRSLVREALAADAEIERTGETYRAEDVHAWARKIAQGVASPRPKPWRK